MATSAIQVDFTEAAAPSTPGASKVRLYAKTDGLLYSKDDAGVESAVSGSGGISSGTSFPGSPANNDLYYRTDLDALFFYDSGVTKWMTVQDFNGHPTPVGGLPYTGTTTIGYFAPDDIGTYTDLYIKYVVVRTQATATQDVSNYWDIQAFKDPASGAGTSLGSNHTQGDAANEWFSNLITINALMGTFASFKMLRLVAAKTGSSGNLYVDAHWVYKRVI